jgi:hypothetical protein
VELASRLLTASSPAERLRLLEDAGAAADAPRASRYFVGALSASGRARARRAGAELAARLVAARSATDRASVLREHSRALAALPWR